MEGKLGGRAISVENRRYAYLGGRRGEGAFLNEFLTIDRAPALRVVKSRFFKDLYGELRAADGAHEVHAHVGLTRPLLKTGCLIAVDGVLIGGDLLRGAKVFIG